MTIKFPTWVGGSSSGNWWTGSFTLPDVDPDNNKTIDEYQFFPLNMPQQATPTFTLSPGSYSINCPPTGGYATVLDSTGQSTVLTFPLDTYVLGFGYATPSTHTLTFMLNGGSMTESTTQTVADGDKPRKPADPVLEGYDFKGWYSDSQLTQPFDFAQPLTADAYAYAKWEKSIDSGGVTIACAPSTGDPAASILQRSNLLFGGIAIGFAAYSILLRKRLLRQRNMRL